MNIENSLSTTFDLCIIGGGPAGIILTLEFTLHNPDKKVILVEYGSKGDKIENSLDNSIKINNPVNHHSPYECTNKGIGGTSATWGGRCVMFDDIDFKDRAVLGKECTWKEDLFEEMNGYLPRTAEYFECGSAVFNLKHLPGFDNSRIAEGFKEGRITDSVIERWSMPTRFGKRYYNDLLKRANLTVLEGYEAREFGEPGDNKIVPFLIIRNVGSQRQFKINAKAFVLAAGTQETTRILLRNKQLFNRLESVPYALGKYYQSHLSGKIASVKFKGDPKKTDFSFIRDADGIYVRRRFQFSTDYLVKENLLNIAIWLDNPLYHDPKHGSGAMSFMYLAMLMPILGKKLAPPAIAHSITKGKKQKIGKHIWNVIKGLPGSVLIPSAIFYKRYCIRRKLPGVFLYSSKNNYALHFHSEQVPVETNYMELGPDNETLIINYSLTETDVDSVIKLHDELDAYLRELGCGKLEYWYPENKIKSAIYEMSKDGIHQSGTTRIADSPEKGVVDSNLKLWGTENVFICSSSVFPTSGQANPTFLLGAFAVRLSNYLTKINENS